MYNVQYNIFEDCCMIIMGAKLLRAKSYNVFGYTWIIRCMIKYTVCLVPRL